MIIVIVFGGRNLKWRKKGRVYYVEESDDGEKEKEKDIERGQEGSNENEECIVIESETEEELKEIVNRKEEELKKKDQELKQKDEKIADLTDEVKTLNLTIDQQESYMQVMKAEYNSVVEESKRGE